MKLSLVSALLLVVGFSAHAKVTSVTCESVVGIQEKLLVTSITKGSQLYLKTPLAPGQEFEVDQSSVVYDNTGFVTKLIAEGARGGQIEINITQNLPDANNLSPAIMNFENQVQNIPDFRCSVDAN